MINNAAGYSSIIHALREADGETIQWILKQIGMEWQMLRQLMLTMPIEQVEYLMEERKDFDLFGKTV
jgi:hypothetical protein